MALPISSSIPEIPSIFPFRTSRRFSSVLSVEHKFAERSDSRKEVALASLLRKFGFPSSQLQYFLKANRALLSSDLAEIKKSMSILLSFKFSNDDIVSLIRSCPSVLDYVFMKKWEAGISQIGLSKRPPSVIRNILVCSRRLELGVEDVRASVNLLKRFRLGDGTIVEVLEKLPELIMMKEMELKERFNFLSNLGFREDKINWICSSCPVMLIFSVNGRLMPLIDEFQSLGFSMDFVRKEILREPGILALELGELSCYLNFVKNLRCRVPIKLRILRNGVFRAGFDVKMRVDCLCSHKLTTREALEILSKEPRVLVYDIHEIEKKIDFLVDEMNFDVDCLLDAPQYLGMNFGKQIVPRYDVIKYLKSKGGIGGDLGLRDIMKISRSKFYNLYVKPYPECEDMYGRFSNGMNGKPLYPFGLWKLLKPRNYPQSKEDLYSLRCFMDS